MTSRINNLSIRNKLRLFTLGTCLILTFFLLASVWESTNRAVRDDVRGELNDAVLQFNTAQDGTLRQNLLAGRNVAASPVVREILSGSAASFCPWALGMLGHSPLSEDQRTSAHAPPNLDLIALLDPAGKTLGFAARGRRSCEAA